jgi:hypothetical protein
LDLLSDFIAQSSRLPTANAESTNRPVAEPIFGSSLQRDPGFQQFSQVAAPLPQPVLPTMPNPTLQSVPQETQKFSCCNPVGSPPADYAPSVSCAKCHYFECGYVESYSPNCSGYCSKFDFPSNSGYTCSGFALYGSVKIDSEESMEAFSDPATALMAKLENKSGAAPVAEITEIKLATKVLEPEPIVEDPEPEQVLAQSAAPEPVAVGVIKQSDLREEAKKALAFADEELYSEARGMAESRFKDPNSNIAREYTRQKYASKYKAKHGSKPKGFG